MHFPPLVVSLPFLMRYQILAEYLNVKGEQHDTINWPTILENRKAFNTFLTF